MIGILFQSGWYSIVKIVSLPNISYISVASNITWYVALIPNIIADSIPDFPLKDLDLGQVHL